MPKPICFMIMPYGKKATQAEPSVGVAEIDFNALWDRAYAPVIETLGYEPVRADQDTGSMIITQMIERLYFADLVLADMTIPNGNVYYEVGIRHAAKEIGCVLLAAEWSKALFDATNAFATSNAGKPIEAIAKLEALIARSGPTPERLGLLGGRYKRLFLKAASPLDGLAPLNNAITAYERGMELDLNQYYCSSNLPRLYRRRKRQGDELRAQSVAPIVVAACERARKRNVADEWLNATLLGAAFDAHDCDKAVELAAEVASQGAARWQIETTLDDLKLSVSQVEDKDTRDRLEAILETLKPPGPAIP